jgi:hypothetical protein
LTSRLVCSFSANFIQNFLEKCTAQSLEHNITYQIQLDWREESRRDSELRGRFQKFLLSSKAEAAAVVGFFSGASEACGAIGL